MCALSLTDLQTVLGQIKYIATNVYLGGIVLLDLPFWLCSRVKAPITGRLLLKAPLD